MKLIRVVTLCLSIIGFQLKAQHQIKQRIMKTFDIQKYDKMNEIQKSKIKDQSHSKRSLMKDIEYIEDDTIIILRKESDNLYREERFQVNSVRKKIYTYFENYSIASEGEYFLGIALGVHKKYSEDGVIIQEVNYDLNEEGFLSILDIAALMKKDFGIDIEREDEIIFMDIIPQNNLYVWRIVCKGHPEKQINHNWVYYYDAKTGEFIKKEKFAMEG